MLAVKKVGHERLTYTCGWPSECVSTWWAGDVVVWLVVEVCGRSEQEMLAEKGVGQEWIQFGWHKDARCCRALTFGIEELPIDTLNFLLEAQPLCHTQATFLHLYYNFFICYTQSANLRNLLIAQRNLRISRLEANLQTVTQSADCACANTCTFCARVWFMDACPGVAAGTSWCSCRYESVAVKEESCHPAVLCCPTMGTFVTHVASRLLSKEKTGDSQMLWHPTMAIVGLLNSKESAVAQVTTIDCPPDTVCLYDSMNSTAIRLTVQKQLATLIHPVSRSLIIEIIESQVQEGCSDCGSFAIANAFLLCNGDGPSTTYWYQDQMRGHLVACLKAEVLTVLTAFPGRRSPTAKEKVLQVMNIPVFCHCRQPEDRTKKMALCQACQE